MTKKEIEQQIQETSELLLKLNVQYKQMIDEENISIVGKCYKKTGPLTMMGYHDYYKVIRYDENRKDFRVLSINDTELWATIQYNDMRMFSADPTNLEEISEDEFDNVYKRTLDILEKLYNKK